MLKKMLACILALLLVLTGSVAAFAAADDLSNHVTVTMWLFPDDYTYYSSYNDNPVVQYLNEKFNMTMLSYAPQAQPLYEMILKAMNKSGQ